jgi:hypothetical protein
VPHQPAFDVHFGTVFVMQAIDLSCVPSPCDDGKNARVVVMMTPQENACPANWLGGSTSVGDDKHVLWLQALTPGNGPYVGVYESTFQQSFQDVNPNSDPLQLGWGNPFDTATIASAVFGGNAPSQGIAPLKSIEYASGKIAFSSVIPGQQIAGTFDARFPDGHVSGSFVVPFCTTACGCGPYPSRPESGPTCEPLNPNPADPVDAAVDTAE